MLLVEKLLASSAGNFYVEDVFSTYLYTGNSTVGGSQTITNGIDFQSEGGMVWIKGRSAASNHVLFDTVRGAGTTAANNQAISSNLTTAEDLAASSDFLSEFGSQGFTVTQGGATTATRGTNYNGVHYSAWTFRKHSKFFDIVKYTGNGANRTISHNLGSAPGCIMIKRTDTAAAWAVYHRSLANTEYLVLNTTAAVATGATYWNSTTATDTAFSLGTAAAVNANGGTYIAYLFAHDAGGFGDSAQDNIISCGSAAAYGTVNLGYEPQWVLFKPTTDSNWRIYDNLRGTAYLNGYATNSILYPDATTTEAGATELYITSSGFQSNINSSAVYIAIRRGPMVKPLSGTAVFNPVVYTGTNVNNRLVNTSIAPDMVMVRQRNDTVLGGMVVADRLRTNTYMLTDTSAGPVAAVSALMTPTSGVGTPFSAMNGFGVGTNTTAKLNVNTSADNHVAQAFKRAPSFFDVVSYLGTGVSAAIPHSLGTIPELIITKHNANNAAHGWACYHSALGSGSVVFLDLDMAVTVSSVYWSNTAPTSTVFTVGSADQTNRLNNPYVGYLFASCPNVSKVGSYTGSATLKAVNCGFSTGARYLLIKRTDGTGDWYTWDSARGITAGNDPYLRLNSTNAEVTTTNFVDTTTTGFEITAAASATVNINGATYIYLAIS